MSALVHSGQEAVVPSSAAASPVVSAPRDWPDTALARTIYDHFAEFEGLNPEEAADSTGALLYSLKMAGIEA